jgi:hypothetical protein
LAQLRRTKQSMIEVHEINLTRRKTKKVSR